MNEENYYVEIVRHSDDKVEKRLGPYSCERMAEKAASGADRNMSLDYFTRVVPA